MGCRTRGVRDTGVALLARRTSPTFETLSGNRWEEKCACVAGVLPLFGIRRGQELMDDTVAIDEQSPMREIEEEPMLDNTSQALDLSSQCPQIAAGGKRTINEVVTAIGDERWRVRFARRATEHWLTAERLETSLCLTPAEWNDFDRERYALTKRGDSLLRGGDDEQLIACQRNLFLVQEGAATPLDQAQLGVDLVGAINPEIEPSHVVQVVKGDLQLSRQTRRPFGGCDTGD